MGVGEIENTHIYGTGDLSKKCVGQYDFNRVVRGYFHRALSEVGEQEPGEWDMQRWVEQTC